MLAVMARNMMFWGGGRRRNDDDRNGSSGLEIILLIISLNYSCAFGYRTSEVMLLVSLTRNSQGMIISA